MKERNWIDIFVGLAALAVSGISLWIGVRTEQANEDMVAATTWPLVTYQTGNETDDGKRRIALSLQNGGVGPAKVSFVEVYYAGRPVNGTVALLQKCCGLPAQTLVMTASSRISPSTIRAGDQINFLTLDGDPPVVPEVDRQRFKADALSVGDAVLHRHIWERLDRARFMLSFRACYCSVLNRCWISDLKTLDPTPVARCPVSSHAFHE